MSDMRELQSAVEAAVSEVGKVVLGKEPQIRLALCCLFVKKVCLVSSNHKIACNLFFQNQNKSQKILSRSQKILRSTEDNLIIFLFICLPNQKVDL